MGKSKKRIIYKGKNNLFTNLSRAEAIESAVELINSCNKDAYALITLFGLSAEELLEAGATYENIKGMENLFQ